MQVSNLRTRPEREVPRKWVGLEPGPRWGREQIPGPRRPERQQEKQRPGFQKRELVFPTLQVAASGDGAP